ncbi:ABC transporter permease subunit [Candidatus Saccharibacteria bacterium]|nr:ABC transporter permease subunit [Candidatus Saccharibacteria bacterium]
MINTIALRSIKKRRLSTSIYSLGLFSFAMMFAALYEDFAKDIDQFASMVPDAFNAFIGDMAAASTPAGWLAVELYGLFVPIILVIIGTGFGASAIGEEEDSGTLELLLASPISRGRIIFEKTLAIAVQLAVVATSVWAGVAIGTLLFNFDMSLINVFTASLSGWLLGMSFGMFTLAIQSISKSRSVAISLGSGIVATTYIANVVSKLVDYLEFIRYLSPFYYFNDSNILRNGLRELSIVLIVLPIVFYLIAYFSFRKRDTGV